MGADQHRLLLLEREAVHPVRHESPQSLATLAPGLSSPLDSIAATVVGANPTAKRQALPTRS